MTGQGMYPQIVEEVRGLDLRKIDYSKTTFIRAAWDQRLPVTYVEMPLTEKHVYCV